MTIGLYVYQGPNTHVYKTGGVYMLKVETGPTGPMVKWPYPVNYEDHHAFLMDWLPCEDFIPPHLDRAPESEVVSKQSTKSTT